MLGGPLSSDLLTLNVLCHRHHVLLMRTLYRALLSTQFLSVVEKHSVRPPVDGPSVPPLPLTLTESPLTGRLGLTYIHY